MGFALIYRKFWLVSGFLIYGASKSLYRMALASPQVGVCTVQLGLA